MLHTFFDVTNKGSALLTTARMPAGFVYYGIFSQPMLNLGSL
jgi:hypothetical protein